MTQTSRQAVTGAFGYTGRFIARCLIDRGAQVIALTNSIGRANPFGESITVAPFNFDNPELLTQTLTGVEVLYNTYWVRFNHKNFTHADAVRNTQILFDSARQAGVKRIVHVSITNPSIDSPLEYFRGKAKLESALKETGVSYAILRPAVFFGAEDILINNIAWAIRRLPIIGVFGNGNYRLRPIHVEDMAELAVREGESRVDHTIDAVGPESYTFRELIETIAKTIGKKRTIIGVGPGFGYLVARTLGTIMGDVMLTRDEIKGLMSDLLYTDAPAVGKTLLSEWLSQNRDSIGRKYANELKRRSDRVQSYDVLKQ